MVELSEFEPVVEVGVSNALEGLPSERDGLPGVVERNDLWDGNVALGEFGEKSGFDFKLRVSFRAMSDADEDWSAVEVSGPCEVNALAGGGSEGEVGKVEVPCEQ